MSVEIPVQPTWMRVSVKGGAIGVDREKSVINGYVIAQEGEFKDSRGLFDQKSLKKLISLGNKKKMGLKSRFTHPTLSADGLGTFLGRAKKLRMDTVTVDRDGDIVPLMAVRGDLHISKTAFNTPNGDLATYVMDLAEEDPDAISSSVVLHYEEEAQLGEDGKPNFDVPMIWRPTELHASDIVDTGAAVDGLLSADIKIDGLNDALVRKGFELLQGFLPGQPREVVEARLSSWLDRALAMRFGDEEPEVPEEAEEELTAVAAKVCNVSYFEARLKARKRNSA